MLRPAAVTAFLSLLIIAIDTTSHATELTADNIVLNKGASGQINVIWTSTISLTNLTTRFQILPVAGPTGGPSGGVKFALTAGEPPVPPMTDTNYVFYGDSTQQAIYQSTSVNPASVTTTAWADDTYNFTDESISGDPYAQNGSRLWTVLNIQAGALIEGTYFITLAEGEYNGPAGIRPTFGGGVITVVPEPSALTFASFATIAALLIAARTCNRKDKCNYDHDNSKLPKEPCS